MTRGERLAANEALFREVNERISAISRDFRSDSLEILCECADDQCTERLTLDRGEYEQLRSSATQFAVLPGHEQPDIEIVTVSRPGHLVVDKIGGGVAVAELTDPR